jgi:putative heme iron utilization protein
MSLSKQARAQCTPLYKTELAQMATQFEKTLKAIKKELPDKASDAKTMTKQAFDHMVEELTKNGSAVDILSVKPEQIAESLCAYASVMEGVTDEMKENFYNAVLPLFHAGGSKVG